MTTTKKCWIAISKHRKFGQRSNYNLRFSTKYDWIIGSIVSFCHAHASVQCMHRDKLITRKKNIKTKVNRKKQQNRFLSFFLWISLDKRAILNWKEDSSQRYSKIEIERRLTNAKSNIVCSNTWCKYTYRRVTHIEKSDGYKKSNKKNLRNLLKICPFVCIDTIFHGHWNVFSSECTGTKWMHVCMPVLIYKNCTLKYVTKSLNPWSTFHT